MIQQLLAIQQNRPLKSYNATEDWALAYYQLTKNEFPFNKAVLGGFTCQQFSFAFMAGYQAALEKMFPTIAPNELKALCVSEAKGGHPKVIQTTLLNHQLTGVKTYVTAGSDAAHLLVLCKTTERVDGKPLLKIVHVPKQADNIKVTNFELPFMKAVKHGKLALDNTKITAEQILEGDGYSQYTKPFRTLEDVCVSAAYQAMLLRQAIDHQWAENLRDQLLLNLYILKNLLSLPPSAKETHLLLSTHERNFENLLPTIEEHISKYASADFKADWEMNKKVIFLGKKLKEVRLAKARAVLFG
ncbi:MAG: hypothetical protein AB8G86_09250 [Saprospiraceae bacterium]